jgi:hypothetical protein
LLAVGHRWTDVRRYSLGQVRAFGAAARRYVARGEARRLIQSAVAAHGDADAVIELAESLES